MALESDGSSDSSGDFREMIPWGDFREMNWDDFRERWIHLNEFSDDSRDSFTDDSTLIFITVLLAVLLVVSLVTSLTGRLTDCL